MSGFNGSVVLSLPRELLNRGLIPTKVDAFCLLDDEQGGLCTLAVFRQAKRALEHLAYKLMWLGNSTNESIGLIHSLNSFSIYPEIEFNEFRVYPRFS